MPERQPEPLGKGEAAFKGDRAHPPGMAFSKKFLGDEGWVSFHVYSHCRISLLFIFALTWRGNDSEDTGTELVRDAIGSFRI